MKNEIKPELIACLNTVKKIVKKTNWKYIPWETAIYLLTDIKVEADDPCYVGIYIDSHNSWTHWIYLSKPCEEDRANARRDENRLHYDVPSSIDFSNTMDDKIIDKIKAFWTNNNNRRINLLKKRHIEDKKNSIDNEDFINKMTELAEENEVDFKKNKSKSNCWKIDDVDIYYVAKDKLWCVRCEAINFSYFYLDSLEEVYTLCKWYFDMPFSPRYK